MQCSQQLAKISTSFTVCDDEQVSQIMCSETFTALCPNVLREFSKKRYRVKVVAAEYPAFPSSALMFVEYFLAGQKIKPSGSLKKKKTWQSSMPLLGNLYKELILEPVKTWRPKAGGALHKVARGAAAIPRDQTGAELGSDSWFSTAHIWGSNRYAFLSLPLGWWISSAQW